MTKRLDEYLLCFITAARAGFVAPGQVVEMRLSNHRPFPNGPTLRLCAHKNRDDLRAPEYGRIP